VFVFYYLYANVFVLLVVFEALSAKAHEHTKERKKKNNDKRDTKKKEDKKKRKKKKKNEKKTREN